MPEGRVRVLIPHKLVFGYVQIPVELEPGLVGLSYPQDRICFRLFSRLGVRDMGHRKPLFALSRAIRLTDPNNWGILLSNLPGPAVDIAHNKVISVSLKPLNLVDLVKDDKCR